MKGPSLSLLLILVTLTSSLNQTSRTTTVITNAIRLNNHNSIKMSNKRIEDQRLYNDDQIGECSHMSNLMASV